MSAQMIARLALLLALGAHARAQEVVPADAPPAAPKCEVALVGPLALEVPAPLDPEVRIPQITAQVLEILQHDPGVSGSRDMLIVINGEIRPYIDATANYLQTRSNYPTLFDRNDSLDLVNQLYTKLEILLNELGQIRLGPKQFNWMSLRNERKGSSSAATLIQKIRYVHFALKFANERLVNDGEKWPEVFEQTRQLYEGLRQVETFLRGIRENLADANVEVEVRLRLQRLMDDVRDQADLIERVHVSTETRIRAANVRQDNVRTLLTVRLPLEAVMGDSAIDLSPLEPPEFAAENGGTPKAALPPPNALDKSIDAIIDLANKTNSSRTMKDMLSRFIKANASNLSIDQAIKVASCTWYAHITNELLRLYAAERAPFLSQDDFIKLGNAARDDASRKAIIELIPLPSIPGRGGVIL